MVYVPLTIMLKKEFDDTINWKEEKELRDLCDKHRKNNGEYDCLVPGSGGKDSIYASYVLKYKYKMNHSLLHGLHIYILI